MKRSRKGAKDAEEAAKRVKLLLAHGIARRVMGEEEGGRRKEEGEKRRRC